MGESSFAVAASKLEERPKCLNVCLYVSIICDNSRW